MKHCWHDRMNGCVPLLPGVFTVVCCWCGESDVARFKEVQVTGHGPHAKELVREYPSGRCLKAPSVKVIPQSEARPA